MTLERGPDTSSTDANRSRFRCARFTAIVAFMLILIVMSLLFAKFVIIVFKGRCSSDLPPPPPADDPGTMTTVAPPPPPADNSLSKTLRFDVQSLIDRLKVKQQSGEPHAIVRGPFHDELLGPVPLTAGVYVVDDAGAVVVGIGYGCTGDIDASIKFPMRGNITVSLLQPNNGIVLQEWVGILDTISSCVDPRAYRASKGYVDLLPYYTSESFWRQAVNGDGEVAYRFRLPKNT